MIEGFYFSLVRRSCRSVFYLFQASSQQQNQRDRRQLFLWTCKPGDAVSTQQYGNCCRVCVCACVRVGAHICVC